MPHWLQTEKNGKIATSKLSFVKMNREGRRFHTAKRLEYDRVLKLATTTCLDCRRRVAKEVTQKHNSKPQWQIRSLLAHACTSSHTRQAHRGQSWSMVLRNAGDFGRFSPNAFYQSCPSMPHPFWKHIEYWTSHQPLYASVWKALYHKYEYLTINNLRCSSLKTLDWYHILSDYYNTTKN